MIEDLKAQMLRPWRYVWLTSSSRWRTIDPVFHQQGDDVRVEDEAWERYETRTLCGIQVSYRRWLKVPHGDSYVHGDFGLEVPLSWAVLFARPCRKCWAPVVDRRGLPQ